MLLSTTKRYSDLPHPIVGLPHWGYTQLRQNQGQEMSPVTTNGYDLWTLIQHQANTETRSHLIILINACITSLFLIFQNKDASKKTLNGYKAE